MSSQFHKRSITGLNSDNLNSININIGRTSLTPNRVQNTNNQTPKNNIQKTIKYFKTSDGFNIKDGKYSYDSINKNRNSFIKSAMNIQTSSLNKIAENIAKRPLNFKSTTSNNTGLPTNFLNKYKEEKLKINPNVDDSIEIKMNFDSTPVKSKSPMIKRSRNNEMMRKSEELKNKTVSPIKVRRLVDHKNVMTVKQNNKENNFFYNSEFKEINTSPLLINRKSTDDNKSNIIYLAKKAVNKKDNIKSLSSQTVTDSNKTIISKAYTKKIRNIHEITMAGCSAPGIKKTNQDNRFIFEKLMNDPNSYYLGVCDGHGMCGHDVSKYIKDTLPNEINIELTRNKDPSKRNYIIEQVFLNLNFKLFNDSSIDTAFSGTTCVTVICTSESIICANIGDSRAVLGRCINGVWTSHNLSRDHKPCVKEEADRIREKGGRIQPYTDENYEFMGPARVWLREQDIPGLAMTRSFGDEVAASVGVTALPEITEWKLTPEDKYIILASDGVWEFIESDECVNIVKDYYNSNDIKGACEYLIKESNDRWLKNEDVIDDTTVILVFFE